MLETPCECLWEGFFRLEFDIFGSSIIFKTGNRIKDEQEVMSFTIAIKQFIWKAFRILYFLNSSFIVGNITINNWNIKHIFKLLTMKELSSWKRIAEVSDRESANKQVNYIIRLFHYFILFESFQNTWMENQYRDGNQRTFCTWRRFNRHQVSSI